MTRDLRMQAFFAVRDLAPNWQVIRDLAAEIERLEKRVAALESEMNAEDVSRVNAALEQSE